MCGEVRPGTRESMYANEWGDVARDDVDTDVETVMIALPSISARS